MFGLFKRASNGAASPSLDSIRFDTAGYAPQGEPTPDKLRVWQTPDGDGLGVYFFAAPPDLPADAESDEELVAFYRRLLGEAGGKLVEARVVGAGGDPAVRTVLSMPQPPSGRTAVGSLTVPFRDFSFVFKCQCAEHGTTGLKAALLFERSRAANEPMTIEGGRFPIPGFDVDDAKYDAEFPHDPVARARQVLDHLASTLVVAAEVRRLPRFALPL